MNYNRKCKKLQEKVGIISVNNLSLKSLLSVCADTLKRKYLMIDL